MKKVNIYIIISAVLMVISLIIRNDVGAGFFIAAIVFKVAELRADRPMKFGERDSFKPFFQNIGRIDLYEKMMKVVSIVFFVFGILSFLSV